MTLDKLIEKNRKEFYKSIDYIPGKSKTYNVLPSLFKKNFFGKECYYIHRSSILQALEERLVTNTPFKSVEIGEFKWDTRDLLIYFDNNP